MFYVGQRILRVLHLKVKYNMYNNNLTCYLLPILLLIVLFDAKASYAQSVPLLRAHAHNDYEQERPLFEALERGFSSIEADIFLIEGELLVAHDLEDVNPERSLRGMYLDPLLKHVNMNNGAVYPDAPPLILLIDIKSDGESTYKALHELLKEYKGMLTRFEKGEATRGAVTAIISGNRPRELMKAQEVRWAAFDGRLGDLGLETPEPVSFIPLVSSNWNQVSSWYGVGDIDPAELEKLEEIVQQAHAEGRLIRFWATSNNPRVWEVLYDAGVDLLNADDLAGLEKLIRSKN